MLERHPQTVFIWRNGDHRVIPAALLKLLELKLAKMKVVV